MACLLKVWLSFLEQQEDGTDKDKDKDKRRQRDSSGLESHLISSHQFTRPSVISKDHQLCGKGTYSHCCNF